MKAQKLYKEIGMIGEDIITEAENQMPVHKQISWQRFATMAACLCIVVAAFALIPNLFHAGNQHEWPIKKVPPHKWTEEICPMPKWDDLEISEQYNELRLEGRMYYGTVRKIDREKLGNSIGTEVLSGEDYDNKERKQKEGMIYSIQGIASECAVAVQFTGDSNYYVYRNSHYKPDTLGQLIDDLDLYHTMSFGSVWYTYQKENGKNVTIEFVDLEDSIIWEMLLADQSIENVTDYDSMSFYTLMGISVDIPILGYENISLSVTDNGYVTTNILDTGKAFYIGKDKVNAFVDYVLDHCKGYEIVYTNEVSEPE